MSAFRKYDKSKDKKANNEDKEANNEVKEANNEVKEANNEVKDITKLDGFVTVEAAERSEHAADAARIFARYLEAEAEAAERREHVADADRIEAEYARYLENQKNKKGSCVTMGGRIKNILRKKNKSNKNKSKRINKRIKKNKRNSRKYSRNSLKK